MKKLALAAALSVAATATFAGNPEPAVIEPEIVIEDTSSSNGGILVPLLFLVLVAAAA